MDGVACSCTKNYFGRGVGLETPITVEFGKASPLRIASISQLDGNIHIYYSYSIQRTPRTESIHAKKLSAYKLDRSTLKKSGAHPYTCQAVYTAGIFDM